MVATVNVNQGELVIPPAKIGLGSLLIGGCLSFLLFGVIVHLTCSYFRRYKNDGRLFKRIVVVLFLAELAHTVLAALIVYHYHITCYQDERGYAFATIPFVLLIPTIGVIIVIADSFYARRLYLLLPQFCKPLVVLVWITLVAFVSGTYSSHIISFIEKYQFDRTLLCSILCAVLSTLTENNIFLTGVGLVTTKVYAISVIVTLNSRKSLLDDLGRTVNLESLEGLNLSALRTSRLAAERRHDAGMSPNARSVSVIPTADTARQCTAPEE
ncbi:uncharacterized protein BXZ73DRAFT_102058 [Epithele typhae]|uniref:uncharacterized protein n=1 Tax=Epithele typhae TaxID=378194 RepID=UPI00200751B3|nr:uncharacterized protein BXZ73DRAFT_102058 [Epithele typhae]KAH9929528.1 hypothetical protein BXZ73DRAFT_102058 [Epithele typhae]